MESTDSRCNLEMGADKEPAHVWLRDMVHK